MVRSSSTGSCGRGPTPNSSDAPPPTSPPSPTCPRASARPTPQRRWSRSASSATMRSCARATTGTSRPTTSRPCAPPSSDRTVERPVRCRLDRDFRPARHRPFERGGSTHPHLRHSLPPSLAAPAGAGDSTAGRYQTQRRRSSGVRKSRGISKSFAPPRISAGAFGKPLRWR